VDTDEDYNKDLCDALKGSRDWCHDKSCDSSSSGDSGSGDSGSEDK
jgi:hypothetical protein